MTHRAPHLSSLAFILLAAACGAEGDPDRPGDCAGGKCDQPADSCELEGRVGDGACDLDCAAPDIDCFHLFDDHAAAEAWFAGFEAQLAAEEGRAPRRTVSPDDPRFQHMRALLDAGWSSYATSAPIGRLDRAPELILIDDTLSNAWATIDLASKRSAWVIMVHTALLAGQHDDDAMLGLVMHELEHAAQLHLVPGTKDRITRYYQVPPGQPEPFGFQMESQPLAAEAITGWIALAGEVGGVPLAEMNGMPLPQSVHERVLTAAHQAGFENDPARCAAAGARRDELFAFFRERLSRFDFELHLGPGEAQRLGELTFFYLSELRDVCLAGASFDVIDVVAALSGATRDAVLAQTPAEDLQLIAGLGVVDQIRALTLDRYGKMHAIDQQLRALTGAGLESMRYYSYEEAADDRAVDVLHQGGRDPAGNGQFLFTVVEEEAPAEAQRCAEVIAAGAMPHYGNLSDPHHAACWRIWHTQALAAHVLAGGALARIVRRGLPPPPAPRGLSALIPTRPPRTTIELHQERAGRRP